jgi:ferrous iron transport protein B
MRFLLAGQPNSGKSTIFNAVAGYRAATANFPGSSVSFTVSRALILGREVEVVDLPGLYSLTSTDDVAADALAYLLEQPYDLVIHVVDASRLGRSLELTLQLLDLGRPLVVALNMLDEARRHGIEIDVEALSDELGVPVVPTIARRGRGLRALFRTALQAAHGALPMIARCFDREVESSLEQVVEILADTGWDDGVEPRFVAGKLLERDPYIERWVYASVPGARPRVMAVVGDLQNAHGWTADQVVSGSRHAVAHGIEDRVTSHGKPRLGWREWADRLLLHPVTGGPLMVAILGLLFWVVFGVGQRLEAPLVAAFERAGTWLAAYLPPDTVAGTVAAGVLMGVGGGVAIVLPYLLPFLIGLALLEDTGYLPRMAYILDGFMHRLGLHGKSVLPLILGYGCSVPAVMATRILESPQDRRITAALAAFIPCSARTVVIYGLVAAFLGPWWALGIYILNLVVVVALGHIMSRRMKGRSPGLILEIPDLSLPSIPTLVAKTWLTLKEFITIAWPLLIASSVVLGLLELVGGDAVINRALAPLTVWALGLPAAVGMTLIVGVLRKELTLVMLVQALGTAHVDEVLSTGQLLTFSLFVVFYVPCVATIAVIAKELGWRDAGWITGLTAAAAIVIGVLSRVLFGGMA